MAFCAACIAIFSGCGNGNPDSGSARPSIALIAEGSKAIARVCELDKHLAARVRFSQRRGREVLAFRLGGRPRQHFIPSGAVTKSYVSLQLWVRGGQRARTRRPRLLPATLNPLARSGLTSGAGERTDDTTRELTSPPERVRTPLRDRLWVRYVLLVIRGRDLPRNPVRLTAGLALRRMGARGGRLRAAYSSSSSSGGGAWVSAQSRSPLVSSSPWQW